MRTDSVKDKVTSRDDELIEAVARMQILIRCSNALTFLGVASFIYCLVTMVTPSFSSPLMTTDEHANVTLHWFFWAYWGALYLAHWYDNRGLRRAKQRIEELVASTK